MKSLPEIQKEILEIADSIGHSKLRSLAKQMSRRRPIRKAPSNSAPCTDEVREAIRQFAADHPAMTQVDIGQQFNVNQGRVSEALRGFRT